MAIEHAKPGEVFNVQPLGAALPASRSHTLCKTNQLEVVRLVLLAGKEIAEHQAPGEITLQCLEGRIAFTANGNTKELSAGQMLYLAAQERHSVKCLENASLLLTILLNR